MLDALKTALEYEAGRMNVRQDFESRILSFKAHIHQAQFSRKDYQLFHKTLSTASASRDLKRAVVENILLKKGEQRNTKYTFR
ncbi:MAG: 5-bromo-4-chloroindolyl phosphate hydrolysis protein [Neolewinella sp.]|jgi:5-bromo-4-chloroindolyl phosphate hydrolysis protein